MFSGPFLQRTCSSGQLDLPQAAPVRFAPRPNWARWAALLLLLSCGGPANHSAHGQAPPTGRPAVALPEQATAEPAAGAAQQGFAAQQEFFESKIRPVLIAHCYECHNSATRSEGGLAVDHRAGLLQGGSQGAAIVPGDPARSLLLRAMRHESPDLAMPQDSAQLAPEVLTDFAAWIQAGAWDPRDQPPTADDLAQLNSWESVRERRRQWWSFQPLLPTQPPTGAAADWSEHPVDRYLQVARLTQSLAPAPMADRATLARRASLVLTGLPPDPAQAAEFLLSGDQASYERYIEQLLSSPHFGERWARHWMDLFRYAESHGSEGDPPIPYAWRYRDYLIQALNADVPYDQLVREHLAGDLLPNPRIDPASQLNWSACGVGHFRMVYHGYAPVDPLDEQVRFIDNQIDTLSKAFLGLTVSCARCHDHKFDPISQADFYAWYGMLASCRPATITVNATEIPPASAAAGPSTSSLGQSPSSPGPSDVSRAAVRQRLSSLKEQMQRQLRAVWTSRVNEAVARMQQQEFWSDARRAEVAAEATHPLHAWRQLSDLRPGQRPAELARLAADWNTQQAALQQQRARAGWNLDNPDRPVGFGLGTGLGGKAQPSQPAVAPRPSRAGEFHVLAEGEQLVANIYPAGVYTHRLSTRDNGVWASPDFPVDFQELWVRVAGGQGARVRFVMEQYPRVIGLLYKGDNLNHQTHRWYHWDMDYWQGNTGYVELSTVADHPVEADINGQRSWFGVAEIRLRRAGEPEPMLSGAPLVAVLDPSQLHEHARGGDVAELYQLALQNCLQVWGTPAMTDAQAEFLGYFVREGLLPNRLAELPELTAAVREYRQWEQELALPARAPGIWEGPVRDQPLMTRGNIHQLADPIPRRFLEVFHGAPLATHQSGRLEFANQLLVSAQPLVNRVLVNRAWHYVFGRGLVTTTDNFGHLGEQPTHPELLDYLAARFQQDGQSLKSLLRLLVTSRTFQLSHQCDPATAEADPENRYWTRFRPRRLDAETLRDAWLTAAGELDATVGGPSVSGSTNRRSVYVRTERNSLDPLLSLFDQPAPHTTRGNRDETTVPAQSLALLNDPWVAQLADRAARRAAAAVGAAEAGESQDRQRLGWLLHELLRRPPTDEDIQRGLQLLSSIRAAWQTELSSQASSQGRWQALMTERQALTAVARNRLATHRPELREPAPDLRPTFVWTFDQDLWDESRQVAAEAFHGAEVREGALVLDGRGYVRTAPIGRPITEKTLEVWVTLDSLAQNGGGVMGIESSNGTVFDSLVFAERQPQQWMAGSDIFNRTQDVHGGAETVLAQPLHLAVTYRAEGEIQLYRNGELYGQPYRVNRLAEFAPDDGRVTFGVRHTPSGNGKMFLGRLWRAHLYDRALSAQEVSQSLRTEETQVSQAELVGALTADEQARWHALQTEIDSLRAELQRRGGPLRTAEEVEQLCWQTVVQTIFGLPEFLVLY